MNAKKMNHLHYFRPLKKHPLVFYVLVFCNVVEKLWEPQKLLLANIQICMPFMPFASFLCNACIFKSRDFVYHLHKSLT